MSKYSETPREILTRASAHGSLSVAELDLDLTAGALVLLAVMRGWRTIFNAYDPEADTIKTPPGGWHGILQCPQPSIARWSKELAEHGLIARDGCSHWALASVNPDRSQYLRVMLRPLLDPALRRNAGARLVWIALHRYLDYDGGMYCYPSHDTLAALSGRSVSNVKTALKILEQHGYLAMHWRKCSRSYRLHAGGDAPTKDELRERRAAARRTYPIQSEAYPIQAVDAGEAYPKQITHIQNSEGISNSGSAGISNSGCEAYPKQATTNRVTNRKRPIEVYQESLTNRNSTNREPREVRPAESGRELDPGPVGISEGKYRQAKPKPKPKPAPEHKPIKGDELEAERARQLAAIHKRMDEDQAEREAQALKQAANQ